VYDKTVRRRRAVLGLLVALSIILLSAFFGDSSAGLLGSIQAGFLDVFAPIQEGVSTVLTPVRDVIDSIDDVVHATSTAARIAPCSPRTPACRPTVATTSS
jgi:rod shape-determining protein MreC